MNTPLERVTPNSSFRKQEAKPTGRIKPHLVGDIAQKLNPKDASILYAARDQMKEDIRKLMELTPGGSEFAGDFDACLRFISDQMRNVMKVAKERNELQKKLAALRQLIESDAPKAELLKVIEGEAKP